MSTPLERTIIIPAYAEERFIGHSLNELAGWLRAAGWIDSTEVIVVTADAPDRTVTLTAAGLKSFPHRQHIRPGPRSGKGRDVRAGLAAAKADHVLFMDADLATPLKYLTMAFDLLDKQGGVLIGVRNIKLMHKTWSRRATSRLSNIIIRVALGWSLKDTQCGFKAFDRLALKIILPRASVNGWGFDFEFLAIARRHKVPISQLPVPEWYDPKGIDAGLAGQSQLSAMTSSFRELLSVKVKQLKGDYQ